MATGGEGGRKPVWAKDARPERGPGTLDLGTDRSRLVGAPPAPGPQGAGASRPRPPAGAGAELRAGPGRHMRWNPRMHPPCSAAGAQQRAGRPFSPRPRPQDFTSAGLAPGPTSKRRPPESSRLRGPGPAARWPLALPWRVGPEKAKMSSVLTSLSSLLHPQSPSYGRHSINA